MDSALAVDELGIGSTEKPVPIFDLSDLSGHFGDFGKFNVPQIALHLVNHLMGNVHQIVIVFPLLIALHLDFGPDYRQLVLLLAQMAAVGLQDVPEGQVLNELGREKHLRTAHQIFAGFVLSWVSLAVVGQTECVDSAVKLQVVATLEADLLVGGAET